MTRAIGSEAPSPLSDTVADAVPEVSGLRMLFGAYRQCSDQQEMVVCLKRRALKMLDRAIHSESIQIADGNVVVPITSFVDRAKHTFAVRMSIPKVGGDVDRILIVPPTIIRHVCSTERTFLFKNDFFRLIYIKTEIKFI